MEHLQIIDELRAYASPEKRETLMYFFKTGKGQYAEGDQFLGVTVPQVRAVARRHRAAPLDVASQLLVSEWHEARLCALFLLEQRFSKADETQQREIVDLYVAHTSYINNWDLVDLSAWKILGTYLLSRPRTLLYRLAQSAQLWEARIAIVSTFAFIRQHQLDDTYALASLLMHHPHDLMHKAVGWMLREAGKRDVRRLYHYVETHRKEMPRTMLRYAIEHFSPEERKQLMRKDA